MRLRPIIPSSESGNESLTTYGFLKIVKLTVSIVFNDSGVIPLIFDALLVSIVNHPSSDRTPFLPFSYSSMYFCYFLKTFKSKTNFFAYFLNILKYFPTF